MGQEMEICARPFTNDRSARWKTGRLTPKDFLAMKCKRERIAAITAYDYTSAQMIDAAGVPFTLVGDTLWRGDPGRGNDAAGYPRPHDL